MLNLNSLKLGQVTPIKNKFSEKGYKILLFYLYPYKGTNKSHKVYFKFLGLQKIFWVYQIKIKRCNYEEGPKIDIFVVIEILGLL